MQKMEFNIQLFGGRGASSSFFKSLPLYEKANYEYYVQSGMTRKQAEERIVQERNPAPIKNGTPTFRSEKQYDKAIENGYSEYNAKDIGVGGHNYEAVVKKLKEQGYTVRVYEETTRVRGMHSYTVLYKRRK